MKILGATDCQTNQCHTVTGTVQSETETAVSGKCQLLAKSFQPQMIWHPTQTAFPTISHPHWLKCHRFYFTMIQQKKKKKKIQRCRKGKSNHSKHAWVHNLSWLGPIKPGKQFLRAISSGSSSLIPGVLTPLPLSLGDSPPTEVLWPLGELFSEQWQPDSWLELYLDDWAWYFLASDPGRWFLFDASAPVPLRFLPSKSWKAKESDIISHAEHLKQGFQSFQPLNLDHSPVDRASVSNQQWRLLCCKTGVPPAQTGEYSTCTPSPNPLNCSFTAL